MESLIQGSCIKLLDLSLLVISLDLFISYILRLLGKHSGVNNEEFSGKYPQDVHMVNQVAAVKAAVASKTPLSVFDNPQMREYLCKLDSKHSPPYCLERIAF
jgi:hypothetical protein